MERNRKTHLGISLLDLASLLGEDNETGLVSLEALNVEFETFLGSVAATVVDGDTEREGLLATDTGSLELLLGESTTGTELHVVALGRASNGGAEELSGTESCLDGLCLSVKAARVLLAGLIEPGLHTGLPVLAEVVPVENAVVQNKKKETG